MDQKKDRVRNSCYYNPNSKGYECMKEIELPTLCHAVFFKNHEKVNKLLAVKPLKYLCVKDKHGRTAYHYAAFFGQKEILKVLIRGSNIADLLDSKDDTGKTPLFKAIESSSTQCAQLLIAQGCMTTTYEKSGTTALHVAVLSNNNSLVETLLDGNANVNATDKLGFTPLHLAAGLGYLEVVKYLLHRKADPNAKDKKGRTPLFGALTEKCAEVIDVLLKNGADPTVVDDYGNSIPRKDKQLNHELVERVQSPLAQCESRDMLKHVVSSTIPKNTDKFVQVLEENCQKMDNGVERASNDTETEKYANNIDENVVNEVDHSRINDDNSNELDDSSPNKKDDYPNEDDDTSITKDEIDEADLSSNEILFDSDDRILPQTPPPISTNVADVSASSHLKHDAATAITTHAVKYEREVSIHVSDGENLSATESMQMALKIQKGKNLEKSENESISSQLRKREQASLESLGDCTVSTTSLNSTRANETVIKIDTLKLEKSVASRNIPDESFVDSLEVDKIKERNVSKLRSLKRLTFEEERSRFLRRKNCELLGKKLEHCKELEKRMKYLIERFTARDLDLKMENTNMEGESAIMNHDNVALQNELNSLRKRNAELNEDITRYKNLTIKQNIAADHCMKKNTKQNTEDFGENNEEDMTSLQQKIIALQKENSSIKSEIELLKLDKLVKDTLPNKIEKNNEITTEVNESELFLTERWSDISGYSETFDTTAQQSSSKQTLLSITDESNGFNKKPKVPNPPVVFEGKKVTDKPQKASRPSRSSIPWNTHQHPQLQQHQNFSSQHNISPQKQQEQAYVAPPQQQPDIFAARSSQQINPRHADTDSSRQDIHDSYKDIRDSVGKKATHNFRKDETDSIGSASITSTGSKKMSMKRLKFWKGKSKKT